VRKKKSSRCLQSALLLPSFVRKQWAKPAKYLTSILSPASLGVI
jgi:hypothetical protein